MHFLCVASPVPRAFANTMRALAMDRSIRVPYEQLKCFWALSEKRAPESSQIGRYITHLHSMPSRPRPIQIGVTGRLYTTWSFICSSQFEHTFYHSNAGFQVSLFRCLAAGAHIQYTVRKMRAPAAGLQRLPALGNHDVGDEQTRSSEFKSKAGSPNA